MEPRRLVDLGGTSVRVPAPDRDVGADEAAREALKIPESRTVSPAVDPAALERLYHDRYSAYRRAVAPMVGRDAAHDVVQDAFARALERIDGFRGGSLEAWVWRILTRTALDLARGRRPEAMDQEAAVALVESGRDPELAAAIRALAPRRRLIVFLRYYADLPYDRIADLTGIRQGTVAATLAQAHGELRAALRPEGVTT